MLKGRDFAFAKRSFAIAASFGMAAILSVIVLGDESGYEWVTCRKPNWRLSKQSGKPSLRRRPSPCLVFPIRMRRQPLCDPDPYALGIIATRSVDKPVIGLKDLMVQHEERIRNGMKAYALLEQLRAGSTDQAVRDQFNNVKKDLVMACC
ncbi:cytochrome d terminal oxidase, polypeptide subunit I [Klebsiella pneumoniae]|uniref:Cytochrome d terminal oxidase, polypeptide subunit I n=1 Tax=Klebsiella pneumoniae TaxID=573 RepID=A0A4P0Y023_KLEPN|nr:cytochrome d terminal oxidase, polypeptide subunit I [Klebsiella pneumoniae]